MGKVRGVYVLVIAVQRPVELEVGRLGRVRFAPGTYAYVGSGMRGLEARVKRHLRSRKKLRWHIDYLLARPEARISGAYIRETAGRLECRVARALASLCGTIRGFGSGDCRCPGHLFRCDPEGLEELLLGELGLRPFPPPGD